MWVSQHLSIAVYRTGTANTSPRPAMLGSYSLESIEQYSYLFLERTVALHVLSRVALDLFYVAYYP